MLDEHPAAVEHQQNASSELSRAIVELAIKTQTQKDTAITNTDFGAMARLILNDLSITQSAGDMEKIGDALLAYFPQKQRDMQKLQQVDPQHRGQRIRRAAAFLARFWVVGLDQSDQRLPRHHHIHLREKFLPLGLLLGGGQLIVREIELPASHQSSPGQRSQAHSPVERLSIPESP